MEIVVDDRTFVVGLCELYREQMKCYEVATLLPLAESACRVLGLAPLNVPLEAYYGESDELAKFFRLVRALQLADTRALPHGPGADAIHRLRAVFGSPVMGRVMHSERVLSRSSSPFGEALQVTSDWSIDGLSRHARQCVRDDDQGLLAVAAASGDPIAMCVARETMALAGAVEVAEADPPRYVWAVTEPVVRVAGRFISVLAATTGIVLPAPVRESAHLYGGAAADADLPGRCILVGERAGSAYPYYHWYIDSRAGHVGVKDFWSSAVWTTDDVRRHAHPDRPAMGERLDAPSPAALGTNSAQNGPPHARKRWFERLFQRTRE